VDAESSHGQHERQSLLLNGGVTFLKLVLLLVNRMFHIGTNLEQRGPSRRVHRAKTVWSSLEFVTPVVGKCDYKSRKALSAF